MHSVYAIATGISWKKSERVIQRFLGMVLKDEKGISYFVFCTHRRLLRNIKGAYTRHVRPGCKIFCWKCICAFRGGGVGCLRDRVRVDDIVCLFDGGFGSA